MVLDTASSLSNFCKPASGDRSDTPQVEMPSTSRWTRFATKDRSGRLMLDTSRKDKLRSSATTAVTFSMFVQPPIYSRVRFERVNVAGSFRILLQSDRVSSFRLGRSETAEMSINDGHERAVSAHRFSRLPTKYRLVINVVSKLSVT